VAQLLLVDDASALAELFAAAITDRLGYAVAVSVALGDIGEQLALLDTLDLAIVDLSFPQEMGSGLDGLAEIHRAYPLSKLAIITQGDEWVAQVLRDAWELLPIATVISKSAPLTFQLEAIRTVIDKGSAPVDPAIQPLLPSERDPRRTTQAFRELVQHAGHAKLWTALWICSDPTYKQVADLSGLKLNTVKNYRAQLVPELVLHGLFDPPLREMRDFAMRCRAFLEPFVNERLNR